MIGRALLIGAALLSAQQAPAPSLHGPELTNADRLLGPDGYPADASGRREQGRTRLVLTVDPTGRTVRCAVAQSSGSVRLDQFSCLMF